MSAANPLPNSYASMNDANAPLYPKTNAPTSVPTPSNAQPASQPQPGAFYQSAAAHARASSEVMPSQQFYTSVQAPIYQPHDQVVWEDAKSLHQESCCARFWKGPFRARSYGLLMWNIFVQFPLAFLCFLWVGGYLFSMFAGMTPMIVGMILGPVFTLLMVVSWEYLVNVELRAQLYAGRENESLQRANVNTGGKLCQGVGDRLRKHKASLRTWEGFWAAFKDITWRWAAWKPALYFALVKPVVSFVSMFLSAFTFFGGLALVFNIVVVAACKKCRDGRWGDNERAHWVFGTYQGSSVTIPLGLFLIFLACFIGSSLARSSANLAAFFFAKKPRSTGSESVNAGAPTQFQERSDIEAPLMTQAAQPSNTSFPQPVNHPDVQAPQS